MQTIRPPKRNKRAPLGVYAGVVEPKYAFLLVLAASAALRSPASAASQPAPVEVALEAPGLFPLAFNDDGCLNSVLRPAPAGRTVALWGTGQGRAAAVEAFVDGRPAPVISWRPLGALFAVEIRIPPETPRANAVPVTVRAAGVDSPPVQVAVR